MSTVSRCDSWVSDCLNALCVCLISVLAYFTHRLTVGGHAKLLSVSVGLALTRYLGMLGDLFSHETPVRSTREVYGDQEKQTARARGKHDILTAVGRSATGASGAASCET